MFWNVLWCSQSLMFWVVDSLMMRKYKTMAGIEGPSNSVKQVKELPSVASEESQVRNTQKLLLLCGHTKSCKNSKIL